MPMRHVRTCAFSCSQAESVHERGGLELRRDSSACGS